MSRTKKVLTGSLFMLIARCFAVLSGLITTSLLARFLSKDSFGLWAVISSFVAFSGGFDLGLGQGLKNKLASLSINSDAESLAEQKKYYLSVFYLLLLIAAIGIVLSILSSPFINWNYLFNIKESQLKNISLLMSVVISCLFLNLPLSLNISGYLAYQESHWRGILDTLQSFTALCCIFITVHLFSVKGIITYYYFSFISISLLSTIFFFRRRQWSVQWIPIKDQVKKVKPLIKISFQFWLLGISAITIFATDPIIASRVAGLAETGDFSIIQKMFSLLIAVHFTILTPLWSAYTQAAENNEWPWIRKSLYRSIYITLLLFGFGGFGIILFHKAILRIWIGREINNLPLFYAMALWAIIYAWINCFSVFLNGLNKIKIQTILIVFSAIANVPLSLYFGHKYGITGVTIGSIISIIPLAISNSWQTYKILSLKRHYNYATK